MNPKQRLRKEADKLYFQAYLKSKCEVCGKPAKNVHHFYYKRSYPYLRYEEANAVSLCMS